MPGGPIELTPSTIASFILFIGILIFVHELGHFVFAKYFGIKVLKFSLGFGPPIFQFRKGETVYQIALLPLGGFVKMLGDSPGDEVPPEEKNRAFNTVPVYQRALVAFAGPLFNLVFPIICFFAYYLLGPTVVSPIVGQVEIGTPAEGAGLQPGDRFLEIDGTKIWSYEHLIDVIQNHPGEELEFKIDRAGEIRELNITPKEVAREDLFGATKTVGLIGVIYARRGQTRVGVDREIGHRLGFQTGDQLLRIDGQPVEQLTDFDRVIRTRRGHAVNVVLSRPKPFAAGGVLIAKEELPVTLDVAIPEGASTLADLGLAPAETFVRHLDPSGAAFKAGLRPGDHILEVDGTRVSLFYSFISAVQRAEGQAVPVKVRRNGQDLTLAVAAEKREVLHEVTGKMHPYWDPGVGLGSVPRMAHTMQWNTGGSAITEKAALSLAQSLKVSVQQTVSIIGSITIAVFKLITGGISHKTVGGPLMLFQVAAMAAERGLFDYLQLLALISVNLGIINLLPIPVFDGGHLLFCAIEAIKRKPVSMRVREAATIIGIVLLAMLFVLVMRNDISRIAGVFK